MAMLWPGHSNLYSGQRRQIKYFWIFLRPQIMGVIKIVTELIRKDFAKYMTTIFKIPQNLLVELELVVGIWSFRPIENIEEPQWVWPATPASQCQYTAETLHCRSKVDIGLWKLQYAHRPPSKSVSVSYNYMYVFILFIFVQCPLVSPQCECVSPCLSIFCGLTDSLVTFWSAPGQLLATRHRHGSLYPRHATTRPLSSTIPPSPSQEDYYLDVAPSITDTEAPEHCHCLNPLSNIR